MDYQRLRRWIRFYEKEGVCAEAAIVLIACYVSGGEVGDLFKDDVE